MSWSEAVHVDLIAQILKDKHKEAGAGVYIVWPWAFDGRLFRCCRQLKLTHQTLPFSEVLILNAAGLLSDSFYFKCKNG